MASCECRKNPTVFMDERCSLFKAATIPRETDVCIKTETIAMRFRKQSNQALLFVTLMNDGGDEKTGF